MHKLISQLAILAILMALAAINGGPRTAGAAPLRPAAERVIAVRGGVLMIPLAGDRPRGRGPKRMSVKLADDSRLEGTVIWLVPKMPDGPLAWNQDSRAVSVQSDLPESPFAQPFLVAKLPDAIVRGPIETADRTLQAIWCELPPDPVLGGSPLVVQMRDDRPDPDSPLEHWRWVMMARRRGDEAPGTGRFDELAALVARHQADLWRIGMHRLRLISPSIETRCLGLLTSVCRDHDHSFGAWITDPAATGMLLDLTLNWNLSDDDVAQAALLWAEDQDPLLMWLETTSAPSISLAIVNRGDRPQVARFAWEGETNDIPVAVEIESGILIQAVVDRPVPAVNANPTPLIELAAASTTDETQAVLSIQCANRRYALPTGLSRITAKPPGAFAHRLAPPLTLVGLEQRRPLATDDDHATFVHLRRLSRRWELFAECRRPAPDPDAPPLPARSEDGFPIGHESLTLILGPVDSQGGPEIKLTIPETGWHDLEVGENDGTLQVYRNSLSDRWYCRIVLPDSWLHRSKGELTLIGCIRTHGDHESFEIAPGATTAWRQSVARSAIDLSRWDDLPAAR